MKKQKNILVTGGAGYIGSHTIVELVGNGYKVVVIDNFSNSDKKIIGGIEKITNKKVDVYNIDLQNKEEVKKIFSKYDIDSIIHFAALKAVGESIKKPVLYYRNNIVPVLNLLEIINEQGKTKNFVFSSSACVYGSPDKLPVNEETETKKAESPYGATKKIAEDLLRSAGEAHDLKVICLRYFNPIGAHKSSFIGELPQGEPNNLMPYIVQTASGEREELKVFGNDYDTHDGYCVRDFIHVVDLAKAHIKSLERMFSEESEDNFEIFNLGTGKGYSVKEVIDAFEKVNKINIKYRVVGRREGDIASLYTEVGKAREKLKWKADYSLEDMLKSSWEWEKYRNKQKSN